MTEESCPICTYTDLQKNYIVSKGLHYSYCKVCGAVFRNPMPTEKELSRLYENYYVESKNGSGYDDYEGTRSSAIFQKHYLPWIRRYAKDKAGYFLDYGCGTGNLVIALKNEGYKNSEGCEFAEDALHSMREKGLVAHSCKEATDFKEKYSYVSLIDVVEHLREPQKNMQDINFAMKKGGVVFIETINLDFLARNFYKNKWIGISPAHVMLFGMKSLKTMLENTGFEIISTQRYKLSGSFTKHIIILFGKPVAQFLVDAKFLRNLFNKISVVRRLANAPRNRTFQFSLGDGVRIIAAKKHAPFIES